MRSQGPYLAYNTLPVRLSITGVWVVLMLIHAIDAVTGPSSSTRTCIIQGGGAAASKIRSDSSSFVLPPRPRRLSSSSSLSQGFPTANNKAFVTPPSTSISATFHQWRSHRPIRSRKVTITAAAVAAVASSTETRKDHHISARTSVLEPSPSSPPTSPLYSIDDLIKQSKNAAASSEGSSESTKGDPGGDGGGKTPWGFVLLAAAAIMISYADRANLATCILPMASELDWSASQQGLVLSSFFAGYAITQVVGGYLADRFGGSLVLQAGMLWWSLLTIMTPFAASYGLAPAIAVRVGLGVGEGVAFPAVHAMIPQYVAPNRRSLAVAIVTAASYLGAVLAFALTPSLIETTGWPSVFYVFGGLACLWFPLWWLLQGRQRATDKEAAAAIKNEGKEGKKPSMKLADPLAIGLPVSQPPASSSTTVPSEGLTWKEAKRILSRKEVLAILVLAILVGQYTQSWGLYGLLSWLPSFYNRAYGVDVSNLAAFTVAPYLAQAAVGIASGTLADTLITNGWRVRSVRRTLQTAGTLLPALFLLLATAGGAASSLTSSFLYVTAGAAFSALTLAAVSVSHLDVCPRHAGFVFGAGNTLATIAGLLSIPVSGYLLDVTQSFQGVFALFAAHYVIGAIVYWAWVGDTDICGPDYCDVD